MRYVSPKLTATYAATAVIQGEKDVMPFEINQLALTSSPAYHSAE